MKEESRMSLDSRKSRNMEKKMSSHNVDNQNGFVANAVASALANTLANKNFHAHDLLQEIILEQVSDIKKNIPEKLWVVVLHGALVNMVMLSAYLPTVSVQRESLTELDPKSVLSMDEICSICNDQDFDALNELLQSSEPSVLKFLD